MKKSLPLLGALSTAVLVIGVLVAGPESLRLIGTAPSPETQDRASVAEGSDKAFPISVGSVVAVPLGDPAKPADGQPLPAPPVTARRRQRPPELHAVTRIPDPLLHLHRDMARLLRPHFAFVRGVSFPVQADDTRHNDRSRMAPTAQES